MLGGVTKGMSDEDRVLFEEVLKALAQFDVLEHLQDHKFIEDVKAKVWRRLKNEKCGVHVSKRKIKGV